MKLNSLIKYQLEPQEQASLFDNQDIEQIARDKIQKELTQASNNQTQTQAQAQAQYNDEDYQLDIRGLKEEQRIINGIHDIYGKLFNNLGLKHIFYNPARQLSSVNLFKEMVLARIANPDSKRGSVNHLAKQFGVKLQLDKVYRTMDKIDDKAIAKLNTIAYQQTRQLFTKIDVIFFDATTLYFKRFTEDEFKRNGYSKDLKFNQPQVVLALMVTKEGLPIGYQAFSGDTFDGHTLIPALDQLKARYDLDKIVFVADSGMFNKDNLAELDKRGFDCIVSSRIKNLTKTRTAEILNKDNYTKINSTTKVARFEYNGRVLLVSHSTKRAKKDKHDRDKGIEKLRISLAKHQSPKDYLSNQGYKKYLQLSDNQAKISLNEDKIIQDSQWAR